MQVRQEVASNTLARAIDLDQLRSHIRTLITLEETEAPVLSCYLRCHAGRNGNQKHTVERRVRAIRKTLVGQPLKCFEESVEEIMRCLATELRPTTRGVEIFARAGSRPGFTV